MSSAPPEPAAQFHAMGEAARRMLVIGGLDRSSGLVEEGPIGYDVPFGDGLWLRAPYVPNCSVTMLADLSAGEKGALIEYLTTL
jgi:hypothetical protein